MLDLVKCPTDRHPGPRARRQADRRIAAQLARHVIASPIRRSGTVAPIQSQRCVCRLCPGTAPRTSGSDRCIGAHLNALVVDSRVRRRTRSPDDDQRSHCGPNAASGLRHVGRRRPAQAGVPPRRAPCRAVRGSRRDHRGGIPVLRAAGGPARAARAAGVGARKRSAVSTTSLAGKADACRSRWNSISTLPQSARR